MHGQLQFQRQTPASDGLRSRKKARTREVIEDAALALFAEQGYDATTLEQIANRADISIATFFHYFPSKADVALSDYHHQIAPFCRAIRERPAAENDLEAVRGALLRSWLADVDPDRTARTIRAVESAPLLLGLSHQIGRTWQTAIAEALACRRGEDTPSDRSKLSAHVVLSVVASAVDRWMADERRDDLTLVIRRGFDDMIEVSADWAGATRRMPVERTTPAGTGA